MDAWRSSGRLGGPRPITGGALVAAHDPQRKGLSAQRAATTDADPASALETRAATVELSSEARTLAASGGHDASGQTTGAVGDEGPRQPIPPALRASYVERFETTLAGSTAGRLIDLSV